MAIGRLLSTAFMVFIFHLLLAQAETNPQDDAAVRTLYASLNMPQLTGWLLTGGDPCNETWQGIECSSEDVIAIRLSGLNLRGSLGHGLHNFTSLQMLDLSNNHIGQMIPVKLPTQIQQMNLGSNVLIGTIPSSLQYLTLLTSLNLSDNLLSGNVPNVFQNFSSLTTLDLSSNNFSGEIPASFSNLSRLTTLHLQDDQLNGTLQALAKLPLKDLNIEANDFTGIVPAKLMAIPNFRYNGNQLNFRPSAGISNRNSSIPGETGMMLSNRFFTGGRLAGVIIAAIVAGLCLMLLVALLSRKKHLTKNLKHNRVAMAPPKASSRKELKGLFKEEKLEQSSTLNSVLSPNFYEQSDRNLESLPGSPSNNKFTNQLVATVAFSFNELLTATRNFSQDNLVGEGMLGCVYKAELTNGQVLAIKRLHNRSNSVKNDGEFFNLISNISRLRHSNIVELVGYCINHDQRFLLYNYHKQGTLHALLHSPHQREQPLSWALRMKIALGAARALEYLHNACIPAVVHRSFKSSNIMLDHHLNPCLSDCGLEILMPLLTDRQVSFELLDSFGYSAPEYVLYGTYTVKSDVFSFGVLMLELLTGRKPLDSSRPKFEQSLVRWSTPRLRDMDLLAEMVDPNLHGMYPAKALCQCAEIISSCVQIETDSRPSMSEVVQSLIRLMQRTAITNRTVSFLDSALESQREEEERSNAISSTFQTCHENSMQFEQMRQRD